MSHLPVLLSGRTLGDRHRQLNTLVEDAFQQNVDFQIIENAPETSALDRLFKIDLASKYQLVNYILKTLRDEDMLYVSRALKSKWLLEPKHSDIINPIYLEQVLFPEMMTNSVKKMKHWLHLHLHDSQRCQQFYEYYVAKNDDIAMSFLWHCSNEFILHNAEKILVKLTPQQLKLMVEICPQFAKLYFDSLHDSKDLIEKYLSNEHKYYDSLKCLLKSDTDLFLDITENYFNIQFSRRLSSNATKFLLKNCKNRIMKKPELYTACVLDVKTLASYLSSDEIKDIITKLARAEYITWFSFKNVEPLLKKLKSKDCVQFKKIIFVDKLIGEKVEQWPYTIPSPPVLKPLLSLDKEHDPLEYETYSGSCKGFRRMIKKRKYGKSTEIATNSSLDKFFNRFRFDDFKHTFKVLQKEIIKERRIENRMQMLLVLVSKTGGRTDTVQNLLQWLVTKFSNEVVTLRAAVVRSLVKRAAVWRLPMPSWKLLLQFAKGLGLDGADHEADCKEGLHAVILRDILSSTKSTLPIFEAYLRTFSSLSEYSLTAEEKLTVQERLPAILLAIAEAKINEDASAASDLIVKALDVLQAYSVPTNSLPTSILSAVKLLAKKDPTTAKEPLLRLYHNHKARKHLTLETFELIQTEASYLNAIRHEPELLDSKTFKQIIEKKLRLDGFLRKLIIYFSEEGGLSTRFLEVIDKEMKDKLRVDLARPLAILAGASFAMRLKYYDEKPRNSIEKRIAYGLKANAHVTRPKFDLDKFGWRSAGVNAVANKVTICSTVAIPSILEKLLEWRRAARLALKLAIRGGPDASTFSSIAKSRPTVALQVALSYIHSKGDSFDPRVWDSVKPIITTIDLSSAKYLHQVLSKVDLMPNSLKAEYAMLVYEAFKRFSVDKAMPILCHIENNLPDVSEEFATTIIKEVLIKKFRLEELESESNDCYIDRYCMYVRIIAKYLLLCRSEDEQKRKMKNVGKPFLETLKLLKSDITTTPEAITFLNEFLTGLKYTRVYMDSSNYVSCFAVLKEVSDWMDENLPINVGFAKHMKLSFNILLFKAIRQISEKYPEKFSDPPKVTCEDLQMIGILFGMMIAKDLNVMIVKLFDSIVDLYWSALKSYINDSFESVHYTRTFAMSVREGILNWGSNSSSFYLAEMLIQEYDVESTYDGQYDDFIDCLSEDSETSFHINSYLF